MGSGSLSDSFIKVFNRDGDSYKRFETDVKNYRDFTLDWYWVCWPWMALPMYGARPLRRYLQHTVENLVGRKIIAGEAVPDSVLTVDAADGELTVV